MAAMGQGEGRQGEGEGESGGAVGPSAPRRRPAAFPAESAGACASFHPAARTRRAHDPEEDPSCGTEFTNMQIPSCWMGKREPPRKATARSLSSRTPASGKRSPPGQVDARRSFSASTQRK